MPADGKSYPSLAELARNDPRMYGGMSADERLAMVQQPYFADRAGMSPEDLQLFQLLTRRNRREQALQQQPIPQMAPEDQGPGILGRLFQFFSGRQAVDPLEQLKQPGYSGRSSR